MICMYMYNILIFMAMSLFDLTPSLSVFLSYNEQMNLSPKACKVVPYIFYPCLIIES